MKTDKDAADRVQSCRLCSTGRVAESMYSGTAVRLGLYTPYSRISSRVSAALLSVSRVGCARRLHTSCGGRCVEGVHRGETPLVSGLCQSARTARGTRASEAGADAGPVMVGHGRRVAVGAEARATAV